MKNWRNPYGVGHQHTRSNKLHPRRHVDRTQRNQTPQWWGCGRDPSRIRSLRQDNTCEWKICSHASTKKMTRIAHVLGQGPSSTRRNNQDIQQRWWTHTMYDDQRNPTNDIHTEKNKRENDNRWYPMTFKSNWSHKSNEKYGKFRSSNIWTLLL